PTHLPLASLAVMLALRATQIWAANYFVSPSGNDGATGAAGAPWQTIQKAASVAGAGDTVTLAGGVYKEQPAFTKSGTLGSPITFVAAAGQTPIVDGTGLGGGVYSPLVNISGVSYLRLDGLEVRNAVGFGVYVGPNTSHIELLNLNVHNVGGAGAIWIENSTLA